ncbi:MAG: helix-turn-helix domain-containing protein [Lachnospiraceae bacterium]|nr:helix-turn-helix domain-containing protein [Lachnospiraceae bacterium]
MEYPTINLVATGRSISDCMAGRGLKVADVCEFMGFVNPQAVYKWKRGETLPSVDNLMALSRLLNVSVESLIVMNETEEAEMLPLAS